MVTKIHNIATAQTFWIFYELENVFVLGKFKYFDEYGNSNSFLQYRCHHLYFSR